MQLQFQKATKAKVKARVAIDGPSGAGKTYSALILATVLAGQNGGKIAVIDTERGSASLYSDKFNFDVLELETFSPALYIQAIEAAERAGYSVIVIDSLSHAWEGEGGALDMVDQKSTQVKGNSYVAWKDVTPLQRRMVDAMLQSPAHIVATMRSKMDYVQETDAQGKKTVRKVGMAPVQRAGMEYEFTIVADMDVDHHISISKSRCEEMSDKVAHKPGPEFWGKFTEWLNSGIDAPARPTAEESHPAQPAPAEEPQPETAARFDAATLRKKIKTTMDAAALDGKAACTDAERKVLAAALGKIFKDSTMRYEFSEYMTGTASTKKMTPEAVNALLKWLGDGKPQSVNFDYAPPAFIAAEANAAHTAALVEKGQQPLI